MTSSSRPNQRQAKDPQFREALLNMLEPDLLRLLKRSKALYQQLRQIRVANGEAVESVIETRHVLRTWIGDLEGVLITKRSRDTASWLRSWDDEGGATDPAPQQPLSSDADTES